MGGVLVVAESIQGRLAAATFELVGAARALAADLGPVITLVAAPEPEKLTEELQIVGVDRIVTFAAPGDVIDPAVCEAVVLEAGDRFRPDIVLFPHSVQGIACAPAVAAATGAGFAADVVEFSVQGGVLEATRGAYGNKLNQRVCFPNKGVTVLTLRGATFPEAGGAASVPVEALELDAMGMPAELEHLGLLPAPPSDIDIGKAEFILSVGRGIGDQEALSRFETLADRIGATLGCSRPVVDAGWLPKAHQVGQSGTTAGNCKVYLALGISGAVQHLHGMKHVETVIAVNTDRDAPIFSVASHGVCMDLFEFADALETQFS